MLVERHTIGIDVGGTKIAFGLFDEDRRLLTTLRVPTPQELDAEAFLAYLAQKAKSIGLRRNLSGVGIGLPCFIRQPEGHIIKSSNIPALRDVRAKALLEQLLPGVAIAIGNDTHAAGLAESRHGAGKAFSNILYCSVSSGISSAPILSGKLFLGSYGFAGESGHMIATPGQGLHCPCGKQGCYMSWCSGHMIVRHIQQWIAEGGKTRMLDLADGNPEWITTVELREAWEKGDAMAARAVEQMQQFFALWFFNLYTFTNINCFVLGGGLLYMGETFWNEVYRRFYDMEDGGCPVFFERASLGDDVGTIGANELLY